MIYVYEYCPVDATGSEVKDEFGLSCKMRFNTRKAAEGFGDAMRLRFPLYKVVKIPRGSRRF